MNRSLVKSICGKREGENAIEIRGVTRMVFNGNTKISCKGQTLRIEDGNMFLTNEKGEKVRRKENSAD